MIDITDVQNNVFYGAHNAIWQAFPWHGGAASPHSSQALAVSVFGTLAVHPHRQVLIDETMRLMFGWEPLPAGEWRVRLEATLPHNLLGERRPSQIDVLFENESSIVMLECKFTEAGGGHCSQTKPLPSGRHSGLVQCNGNYILQINPVNGKEARCALTAKGIKYWEHVPAHFDWANNKDHIPCPLARSSFQYVRNALAAVSWARRHKLERAAVGLVYAAGEQLPMSREVSDPDSEWNRFVQHVQPEGLPKISPISYQCLLQIWRLCCPQDEMLDALNQWVDQKVSAVGQQL